MSEPEDKTRKGGRDADEDQVDSGRVEAVDDRGVDGSPLAEDVSAPKGIVEARATGILDAEDSAKPFMLAEYGPAGKSLDDFFRNEALSHGKAVEVIQNIFPSLVEADFDVKAFIGNIPPKALFSTSNAPGELAIGKEEMMIEMHREVLGDWRINRRAFLKTPAFGRNGFNVQTALKCPRFIGDDQDLTGLGVSEEDGKDPLQALRYKVLFLKASHEAFPKDDGHRTAYMAAQLSTLIGKNVGARFSIPLSEDQRIFDIPSLAMFKKGKDVENARIFIKAILSLILPDKGDNEDGSDASLFDKEGNLTEYMVQEDFVLVDLMGLAKKMEIYKDFKEIFAAIFKLRHLSFVQKFHLSKGKSRRSLMDILVAMKEHSGEPASVFSLGHGDGVLEKELLKQEEDPIVSDVTGVDLHGKPDLDLVEDVEIRDNMKLVNVAKGKDTDKNRIERVFAQFDGQADIGVAADSLHETENPFAYILKLYEKIKPGGFLYVTDPIHCQATDKMTSVTLNPFDNTRHESSMLSLEQYFEILGYLTMKGAKIYDISITPSAYAGYNDTFWRITFSIRKPDLTADDDERRDSAPYKLPIENIRWGMEIISSEDVFNVWPLSCVNPADREKVLEMIERKLGRKAEDFGIPDSGDLPEEESLFSRRKITFGDVKPVVIMGLLGGGEDLANRANELVHAVSPYGAVLPRLFANLRNSPMNGNFIDTELESFNHFAGEILAIVSLLKTECEIDISEKIREVPGWRDVEF